MLQEQTSEYDDGARPLLRPVALGDLRLPNRVVMAPLTRCRATNEDLVPTDLHAVYYAQRAGAGLIVAEGTWVSERAIGLPHVPGIYGERQVAAWSRVTGLVHALGGRIVLQLWYPGDDARPVREMTLPEIERVIAEFAAASGNARRAGFDGVEIAANGTHLIARFLNRRLNTRTDGYGRRGGRLLFEIVDAVAAAWDGRRVGVRLSPYWGIADEPSADRSRGEYPFTGDDRTLADYDALVAGLGERPLAYLHLRGPVPSGPVPDFDAFARYRKLFDGPLIANHGFDRDSAGALVEAGLADAVSFARLFVANPDLVARFALGHETAADGPGTHYTGGPRGYVDYPVWPGSPAPVTRSV
ncbi:oxidoreductase [Actinoallomurus rhizosphaericola]|uniref:oxidoreductase n=1 Tax=Actinoallomurus rhizosphaericola TaxID=2952536 RepID=UPI002092E958|nr:alkene reductase [Actinoallomurus rhizosphaericola]MCO5997679.1 alkene reductase [Actinoallomurus rhizosphaericola]